MFFVLLYSSDDSSTLVVILQGTNTESSKYNILNKYNYEYYFKSKYQTYTNINVIRKIFDNEYKYEYYL